MPQIDIEKPRPLCPTGPATFRLKSVEAKEFQSYSGEGMVTRWIWTFISNRRTPDGDFYELPIFTGTKYGNNKAKLTWLLDMVQPGITASEAARLNTDAFVGMDFEGNVKHVPAEKDPTQKIATFLYLKPLVDKVSVEAVVTGPDPFTMEGEVIPCETCGTELTELERQRCAAKWSGEHFFCTMDAKKFLAQEADLFAAA